MIVYDGALACTCHLRLPIRWVRTRPASRIVLLEDEERAGRCLVLKLPRADTGPMPEEARPIGEAAVLARLRGTFTGGVYRVPRLVSAAPDNSAVLMEAVGGTNLYNLLDSPRAWLPASGLGDAFEGAGRWLAAFARETQIGWERFGAASMIPRLRAFLSDLEARDYPAGEIRRLTRLAERAASAIEDVELPRTLIQGDFTPAHVFLDDRGVVVLDFEQCALGWPHEDAAFFLGAIDVWRARNPQAFWSPAVRAAPARFLRGYRDGGPQCWESTERFFRVAAMIRWLMIEYRSELAKARPFAFKRLVLPQLERRLALELRRDGL
jgi:Ser/Thr protein kinase RdoA (MazF antagonist)